MARLIVNDGSNERVVELAPGASVKIGRDAANEIPLPDETKASRRHCQVLGIATGGVTRYEVTDLGSTNKTRVGGKVVERKVLSHGDVIQIGVAEIRFEDEAEERMLQDAGSQGVCYLEWATKERKGEKVWLRGSRTTFGRRESSTVPLDDRMASGHHAEIIKDLNGYTLRDLGSTNGTLVNGEPASEVALSHGSRIRIGNSRFVFKDPSMKDIEVELAQFDEEDGWGMLGDVDLSRAKGSYGGLLAGLVLLVAAAGGAWLFIQGEGADRGGAITLDANLITDGSFQDETLAWSSSVEGAPVRISGGRGKGLTVSHDADGGDGPARATYAERFAGMTSRPFELDAKVRASGPADLLAVWSSPTGGRAARVTPIARAIALPVTGGRVKTVLVKPSWAENLMLAVRVAPEGRMVISDIRLELGAEGGPGLVGVPGVPGTVKAWANPTDGALDLVEGLAQLFVGARPVARMGDGVIASRFQVGSVRLDGTTVEVTGQLLYGDDQQAAATVRWSRSGEDGLGAEVRVEGAQAVGLALELPRDHLVDGVRLLTPKGPQTISARAGGEVDGVRKVLTGATADGAAGLVTWAPVGDGSPLAQVRLEDALDASLLEMQLLASGSSAAFKTTTDYGPSGRTARSRLDNARQVLAERPIDGVREMRAIAQEFPFNDSVRDEALRLAAARESELAEAIDAGAAALRAHEIFGSDETLAEATRQVRALASLVGVDGVAAPDPQAGPLVTRVHEMAAALATARADHLARAAGDNLGRLERLADMLQGMPGYEPMAALYLRILVDRYGQGPPDPALASRVEEARARLQDLRTNHPSGLLPDPAASGR